MRASNGGRVARGLLAMAGGAGATLVAAGAWAQGPPTAPFPAVVEVAHLDGVLGFRLDGRAAGDRCGASVGPAGDFNGDGVADLLIGAPDADAGGLESGEAYIVLGRAGGFPPVVALAGLSGASGMRLTGSAAGDQAGWSVSVAGDVNGDGLADVIVGAPGGDRPGGAADAGRSYVVFGRRGALPATLALGGLDGLVGFAIAGASGFHRSGSSVAVAGDLNGDGLADLAIGAPNATVLGPFCCTGEAHLVFGRDGSGGPAFPADFALPMAPGAGVRLVGEGDLDRAGWAVAAAGDLNGDGLGDVVVSAPEVRDLAGLEAGASYVVFGRAHGWPATLDLAALDGVNGFRLWTPGQSTRSGWSVAPAGDLNGDGVDDLAIGTLGVGAYVLFGQAGGFGASVDLGALGTPGGADGFHAFGSMTGAGVGWAVAPAGDLNGDGVDDLAVGAPAASPGGRRFAGSAHVVFGRDAGGPGFPASVDLSTLPASAGFRVDGAAAGDGLGHALWAAGDVNADGAGDLIIGAHNAAGGSVGANAAYVVYGRAVAACPADLDGDGLLSIFDFLAFQNLFDAGDPRADFDGDGALTIFDFLAFQNAFGVGCG